MFFSSFNERRQKKLWYFIKYSRKMRYSRKTCGVWGGGDVESKTERKMWNHVDLKNMNKNVEQ